MSIKPVHMKFYDRHDIDTLPQLQRLSSEDRFAIKVVSAILPFRVNNYILEQLIDWDSIPDDPIYQLTFMHKEMLQADHFKQMAHTIRQEASSQEVQRVANSIRLQLNPHPGGQLTDNVPLLDKEHVLGVQHKYPQTCLIFPASGQTCHAYCTYCFRWPQFIGIQELKFATDESNRFQEYLRQHQEITDVLITGGDPMVMSAKKLAVYVEPLLEPAFEHIQSIRIGTKSVAYWPYRYVTDKDADEVLRLFERIVQSGKHLAIMGHYDHWKELATPIAEEAIRRVRSTGAVIRTQAPIVRHVNDSACTWVRMWEDQVRLGCIPYYMFVARDTGAKRYFEVPLQEAYHIFSGAYRQVSGLSRTVRGPTMSAHPGKIVIEGITTVGDEHVFVLTFLQARNPEWCKRPFFAKFDAQATWIDQLRPAFNQQKFFYET